MTEHSVTVTWRRTSASFDYETYNRDRSWSFGGGVQEGVPARGEVTEHHVLEML